MRDAIVIGLTGALCLAGCPNVDSLTGTGVVLDDTARDGGPPNADGGSNGPDDSTDRTRFCLRQPHDFCADFDEGALADEWTDQDGSMALDTERAHSAPRSVKANLPRRENEEKKIYQTLFKRFEGAWRHVHVEFEVWVEKPEWKSGDLNTAIFGFQFFSDAGQDRSGSFLFIADWGSSFTLENSGRGGEAMGEFPYDRWVHVAYDMDPFAGEFVGSLGDTRADAAFTPLSGSGPTSGMLLWLGLASFNDPVPAVTVYYDDVTVDFR